MSNDGAAVAIKGAVAGDELSYDDLFKGTGGLDDALASHEQQREHCDDDSDGDHDDDGGLRAPPADDTEEISYTDLFKGEIDDVLASGEHANGVDGYYDDSDNELSSSSRHRHHLQRRRRSLSSRSMSATPATSDGTTAGTGIGDEQRPTSPRAVSASMFSRFPHKSRILKRSARSEHRHRDASVSPSLSERPSTTGRFRRSRESDFHEESDSSSNLRLSKLKGPKSLPSKIHLSSEERMAQFIGRHRPRKSIFLRRKSSGLKHYNLGYQTAPLSAPILNGANKSKSNSSLSLKNFKYVQEFMQVETEKSRRDDLGALIVTLGLQKDHLRDEIVLQLYKQTTRNPDEKSTVLGWKLLAMCLSTWPPSADFDDLLRDFCRSKTSSESKKEVVFLLELCDWILSTWIADKRSPLTRLELDHLDEFGASFYSPAKFAYHSSLSFQLSAAERHHDLVDGIPPILHKLCASVLDLGGRDTQGIFRVAASRSVMMETRLELEKNLRSARIPTAHVAADLLKHWLRSLSCPLFPAAQHSTLLDAARANSSPEECMNLATSAVSPAAFVVLKYLLDFFGELSKFEEKTSMGASNFAIILAPSIIVITDIDVTIVMEKSPLASKFVENLIVHCKNS